MTRQELRTMLNGEYDKDEAMLQICKILEANRGVFSSKQEAMIRYWGRWLNGRVVLSAKKVSEILGVAPQTVQSWVSKTKWKEYKYEWAGFNGGYNIPLEKVVEEAKYRIKYGHGPAAAVDKYDNICLDEL